MIEAQEYKPMVELKEDELRLFFSKAKLMGYVFRSGKSVHFQNHTYATDDLEDIKELEREADKRPGGPRNFYMDPAKMVISTQELKDPNYVMREQIKAELMNTLRANNMLNDAGNYEAGKLNPTNSAQLVSTMTSSQTQAMAANPATNTELAGLPLIATPKGGGHNPGIPLASTLPPGFVKVNLPS